MGKRKSLGKLLGERMLEYAKKHKIPIIKSREPTQEEAERIQRIHRDVSEFLKNLNTFEQESRKVSIRVKASSYNSTSAPYDPTNFLSYSDLSYQCS